MISAGTGAGGPDETVSQASAPDGQPWQITSHSGALPAELQREVAELDLLVCAHDGVSAFSEQSTLAAASEERGNGDDGADQAAMASEDPRLHFLVHTTSAASLIGYACLNQRVASAELAVIPAERRRGIGRELLSHCRSASATHVWAHGDVPAARAAATALALAADRRLLQMSLALEETAGGAAASSDAQKIMAEYALVSCRELTAGDSRAMRDFARAWVELNAAAFAHHREQGALREADFLARTTEAWFDPDLLLVVPGAQESDWRSAGFAAYLWLKPQSAHEIEVYAIGVSPGAQGRGIGSALMRYAIAAMTGRYEVMTLYVDGGTPAEKLYRALGFGDKHVDVQYALGRKVQ